MTARRMAGMTLLVLVLTMGVLAVITGLGLTNLRGTLAASRESRDVREIEEHLLETRSVARNLGTDVTLSVSGNALLVRAGEAALRSYVLGDTIAQVSIDTATGTLTFNARGGINAGSPADVVVVTDRRQVHRFRIYPAIVTVRRGR